MTFADTVRFLFALGPELKTIKWDLDRVQCLLAELGNPHRGLRVIHVAGTNGKGSTCAMIASSLRAAGLRTGFYSSPHLVDPRERIQIDGCLISEHDWTQAFEAVHGAAERLLSREAIDTHPSFFETVTAMAFVVFGGASGAARVDAVVLEVGLGGRLDATNVVDPTVCVITPIDFDHEAFLGSSIEAIAGEKAGILKPGRPAVFAAQRAEALAVLTARAAELSVPAQRSEEWSVSGLELNRYGSHFTLHGPGALDGPVALSIHCPLAGAHQVENARTAAVALYRFGLAPEAIERGIAKARWPGRLERVATNPDVILDGAHNPAGAAALAGYIREFFAGEPIRIVYGAMRDKAVEEVTNQLFPLAAEVILTAPDQPRALSPESLLPFVDHPNVRTAKDIAGALQVSRENPMTTFVTGSLFLVGEARALLMSAGLSAADPHANFRAEVACYTAADPMPTLRNLSELTGVPVDQLIRYVLVKYAASASDALLSLDPIVFRQMRERVEQAEAAGTESARLEAYQALKEMIAWLSAASS